MRAPSFIALPLAVFLVAACGASSSSSRSTQRAPTVENPRYHADVPLPVVDGAAVEAEALAGARTFLVRELATTGGVTGQPRSDLPAYVFHVTVSRMEARGSGRTRASVEVVVRTRSGGRIVGALRATATAFVERSQPLAVRQQRAIEGALSGALRQLPELLARDASGLAR